MMQFTDATGLLGNAVAIVAASSTVLGAFRMPRPRLCWLLAAVFLAALIPLGGLPLAAYLRGAIGDLSMPSLILMSLALLRALAGWQTQPDRNALLILIGIMAIAFYPLALGWGDFDPYRLGYGNPWFLACLLGLALLALLKCLPTIALVIALAILAWSAGWYESTNIWDYLLDPLVAIYAAVALAMQGMRRLWRP